MTRNPTLTKKCSGCKEYKPFSEYHISRATKSGRCNKCKCCIKEYQQGRRNDPEVRARLRRSYEIAHERYAATHTQSFYAAAYAENLQKECGACQKKLPITSFAKQRSSASGFRTECKSCSKRYTKTPQQIKRKRDYWLRSQYGITLQHYNTLMKAQGSVCAICKQKCTKNTYLSVDHCHDSKQVRGLLCHRCNAGIGMLQDDPVVAEAAFNYLLRS